MLVSNHLGAGHHRGRNFDGVTQGEINTGTLNVLLDEGLNEAAHGEASKGVIAENH